MEKHLVRSAFSESGIIPEEILWRRKEGFSDGVLPKKKPWHVVLQEVMSSKVRMAPEENTISNLRHLRNMLLLRYAVPLVSVAIRHLLILFL